MSDPKPPSGKRLFERQLGGKLVRKWVPKEWRDDHALLYLFGMAKHGEEKFWLWKAWVQEHWPEPVFKWCRWSDMVFAACCGWKEKLEELTGCKIEADYAWWKRISLAGAASSGKSSCIAMWVLGNWIVAQQHTACILSSTSLDQLKRRIWAELVDWIGKSRHGFKDILEVISSDTVVRMNVKDTGESISTRSAIFGRAVDQGGSLEAAKDRIKGVHAPRVFVCVDEASATPEAITTACRNLETGTVEFQLFLLANPTSKEDQHGIYSEPINGWHSVTIDDECWLTSKGGVCIRLDGYHSPALEEPDRFPFYVNRQKIDDDIRFFGGEEDPQFYIEVRAWWPPTGLANTVMDSALLEQFNTREYAVWKNKYEMCAFLDVAFEGGDRRILYPFKLGEFDTGVTGFEFQPPIVVTVDASADKRFLHYAIASAVKDHCQQYKDPVTGNPAPIPPQNFMMDVTGEGAGPFSILSGSWSPDIKPCEFGGAADDQQIYPDRPTTYHELYANRVTMLWYLLRGYIEGDQVRGLSDPETRTELTKRPKDKPRGGKIAILPKSKMRGMKHRSPDKGDAAVGAAYFVYARGIGYAGTKGATSVVTVETWNKWAAKQNMADDQRDYRDEGANFA